VDKDNEPAKDRKGSGEGKARSSEGRRTRARKEHQPAEQVEPTKDAEVKDESTPTTEAGE
jgi:hypothetical protein